MQVRRKTPILEARQFTEVSAHGLIQDGWLKAWVCDSEGMKGNLTRSAGRTSDVRLGDWIILEDTRPPADHEEDLGMVRLFRAISAEQFTEDFEVVPGTVWTPLVEASNGEMVNHPGMPIKAADPGVPTMDLLETDGPSKAKK